MRYLWIVWIALSLATCGDPAPTPPEIPPAPLEPLSSEQNQIRTLSWVRPLEYEDGSPLNDLAGFRIYLSGYISLYKPIDVSDPGRVVYQLELGPGDYQVYMTAYTESGIESLPSNRVAFSVD